MPEAAPSFYDGDAQRRPARARWHRRIRSSLRRSLRLKLIVLFLLFAGLMSIAFIGGMQRAVSPGWREAGRPIVADYVDRLAADIGTPPDPERARLLAKRLPLSIRISGPVVNWRSGAAAGAAPPWNARWRHRARDDDTHDGFGGEATAGTLLMRKTADGHRIAFGFNDEPSWQSRSRRIGAVTLGLLLLLTAVAYGLIARMLRPMDHIRAGAQRFGAGDFTQPIPVRREDELGDLARRINTSAERLHRMLEGKRALLLAISHELRSPLTRARLNTELLPTADERDERLRAALLRDLGEMRTLIEALLEGERLASPHAALLLGTTDLGALARSVVAELTQPGAPPAHEPPRVLLTIAATLPDAIELDAARIRVLLRNLLDNALRHGRAAQPPELTLLRADAEHVLITVRDFGPGVDAALLPHLTEAFLRADSARGRTTGGAGLGLYLCRLIVEAHGGTLDVRNAMPGLEWRVRLPLRLGTSERK